jgi:ketosteroid isomerase-like protein
MGLLADDAVLYIPGNSPRAGEYRGKEAIAGFMQPLHQLSEVPLHTDLHYILTGGDEHVVAAWTAHAMRKGISYRSDAARPGSGHASGDGRFSSLQQ